MKQHHKTAALLGQHSGGGKQVNLNTITRKYTTTTSTTNDSS